MSGPVTKGISLQTASGGKGGFSDKKPEPEPLNAGNGKKQARILFVDDDPLIPRSIVRAIGSSDYDSKVFVNPHEALESYKSSPVDLVVSDYNMKCDMDGLGLLQALKAHDPSAKVVVLSGGLGDRQRAELFRSGAEYVLPKPFDIIMMKLVIRNVIDNKKMGPARVLVVDDDGNISHALASLLEADSNKAETAENGLDAYAKYSSGGFDLVISDLNMPLMNGLELLQMIRRSKPDAKMIMMSGDYSEDEKRALYAEGAVAVIEKPINLELLRVAMVAALG